MYFILEAHDTKQCLVIYVFLNMLSDAHEKGHYLYFWKQCSRQLRHPDLSRYNGSKNNNFSWDLNNFNTHTVYFIYKKSFQLKVLNVIYTITLIT